MSFLKAMRWDDMRVFLVVAQARSLAAAARRLRLSQATVWRRMRSLEASVGTALFERRSTGYVLTARGNTFLQALDGVETRIAGARRRLAEGGDVVEGETRVSSPEVLAPMIAERACDLYARHPGLRLEVVSASPIADLRDADIRLVCERSAPDGFWIRDVYPMHFGLYAAPSYITAHGAPASLDSLGGHCLIAFDHSLSHAAPESWRRADLGEMLIVLRASSPHARARAARAGLGLALLPCWFAGADPALQPVLGPEVIGELEVAMHVKTEITGEARVAETVRFLDETLRIVRSA